MMKRILVVGSVALALVGCASAPLAPRVAVMPAPGKPFEVFVAEERICRQYAEQAVGVGSAEASQRAAVDSAVVGTAVGALAGAAIGGRQGAAVGAGGGLIVGSSAGAGASGYSERDIQRRYDIAYQQCMYAKGNQIPGYYAQPSRAVSPPPPPPPPPASSAPSTPAPPPPPPKQ
jgi:outer membrane lipoprotein SlyB